jgi:hypothetical protein
MVHLRAVYGKGNTVVPQRSPSHEVSLMFVVARTGCCLPHCVAESLGDTNAL